jgi:rRNA processing protein Gar1
MKRLGVVENLIYDGSLLVRVEFAPPPGTQVVDKRRRPVGKVRKVFGPVRQPFATVRPFGKAPMTLIGSDVYVGEGMAWREKSKRRKR